MKNKIINALFDSTEDYEERMKYFKPMIIGFALTIIAILI